MGLNWLHTLWNLTSLYPLSYSQSHFCLPCWWCQQHAQALISLQCSALLCALWEVQEMGIISLFVVPSMCLHRLSMKLCRAAVELKESFHCCPKGVQWEQNVLLQECLQRGVRVSALTCSSPFTPAIQKSRDMSSTSHVMFAWSLAKQI